MTPDRLVILGVVSAAILLGAGILAGVLDRPAGIAFGSALGIEVPQLGDPAMIRRGAAHYDRVCARCHASPDRPNRADTLDLSPSPPKLHLRVAAWSPEVLFATVKHGIPRSGMPAWPTQHRDDDVWSMVAFLTVLPGMDSDTYRGLAGLNEEAALPAALTTCVRCHGAEGRGTPDGAFPRLDIQTPAYLYASLLAFRDGRRESGFMQSAVSGLRDDELRSLAEHFGRTAVTTVPAAAPVSVPAGTPSCTACHGPPDAARAEFPRLAGQYENYLLTQLKLFADKETPRGGGAFVELMREAGRSLTDAEMVEYAKWYAAAR